MLQNLRLVAIIDMIHDETDSSDATSEPPLHADRRALLDVRRFSDRAIASVGWTTKPTGALGSRRSLAALSRTSSNPVADHPNLPLSWSKTENVEWVADLPGVGWSSPVVWGRRVFLTAATSDQPMKQPSLGVDFSNEYLAELRKQGLSPEEINKRLYQRDREMPDDIVIRLMLYCHDLETGKKLWERQLHHGRPAGGRHSKNSFASETPITDGERIYVYLTDYGLFAYDFDGKQTWATPLKPHGTTRDWGTGASPALHNDRLFILNDNEEQSFVAAFDTRTGKEVWRTPRTVQPARKTGWSTPFVWEHRARTELVTLGPASPSATVSTAASCGA